MAALDAWDSFYVIVGSSAGALIGLQFVVMTLIAERPLRRAAEASTVFGTPNVVHFGTALLLSALLPHAVALGASGARLAQLVLIEGACTCKRHTHPISRTGCAMPCCL